MSDIITPPAAPAPGAPITTPAAPAAPSAPPAASPAPVSEPPASGDIFTPPTPDGGPDLAPAAPPADPPAPPEEPKYQPVSTDERVRAVEDLIAEKGLTVKQVQEIFAESVKAKDFNKINTDKLKEYLGEATAKIALNSLKAIDDEGKAQTKKLHDTALHLLGGEAQFKEFSVWVNAQKSTEVQELRKAVANGGHLAYVALNALNEAYKAAVKPSNAEALITPDSGNGGTPVIPFKNRREYVNAMKEAQGKRDSALIAEISKRFAAKPV